MSGYTGFPYSSMRTTRKRTVLRPWVRVVLVAIAVVAFMGIGGYLDSLSEVVR